MKKYICLIVLGIIFLISGSILAASPNLILKCDGNSCTLYRNFYGQIIRARYKFSYSDVQICEVKPVKVIAENGETDVKTYTLRLKGDNLKYLPEWVNKDNDKLSAVCSGFFKRQPIKYEDSNFINRIKFLWIIFIACGIYLIIYALGQFGRKETKV